MIEKEELGAWLRLLMTPGVGPVGARRLLKAFGSPEAIFMQGHPGQKALEQIPEGWADLLERTWGWLQDDLEHRAVVTLGDAAYPKALLDIDNPPLLLHVAGQIRHLQGLEARQCLAMVGSRNPTPQGLLNARQFAHSLAQAGFTIVSGLALGVDGAAHEGSLEGASGQGLATIAVVGTGLDVTYPKRHAALTQRILAQGLVVSEYPLGTPPLAENFPRRNRIIAGLACATLVVEAAPQSGSLITARLAAEQGKDVLAIPGSIHSPQARGCHMLIRQGAKLVESAQDVLEELPLWAGARQSKALAEVESEDPLIKALGTDPVSLDALQERTGWPTAQLQARLMALELEGLVARLPGGLLQRLMRA